MRPWIALLGLMATGCGEEEPAFLNVGEGTFRAVSFDGQLPPAPFFLASCAALPGLPDSAWINWDVFELYPRNTKILRCGRASAIGKCSLKIAVKQLGEDGGWLTPQKGSGPTGQQTNISS